MHDFNAETGLLISNCDKLDKDLVYRIFIDCENSVYPVKKVNFDLNESNNSNISPISDELSTIPNVNKPHGNSTKNTNFFIPKSDYIKDQLKSKIKDCKIKSNIKIQDELINQALKFDPTANTSNLPGNSNQIKYEKRKQAEALKLHCDDILATLCLTKVGLDHFIFDFDIYPSLQLILAHPGAIELAKRILKYCNKNSRLHIMTYDTTFNLTTYYVSILVMKNIELTTKDNTNPIFPIAFLIHQKRDEKSHLNFFKNFAIDILDFNKFTCFVTDREKSIINSIDKSLESKGLHNNLFFCTIHLINDLKFWVDKHLKLKTKKIETKYKDSKDNLDLNIKKEDEIFNIEKEFHEFQTSALKLFDSKSAKELDDRITKSSSNWPDDSKNYFNNCIKPALENNINKRDKFEHNEFISDPNNNLSESLHSSLKKYIGDLNLSLDSLVLELYRYSSNILFNFNRAYNKEGSDYFIDDKFSKIINDKFLLFCPYHKDFKDEIKELNENLKEIKKIPNLRNKSQLELAKDCLKQNKISVDFKNKIFTVDSPFSTDSNSTELPFGSVKIKNNKSICYCPIKNICFHRLAVDLFINKEDINIGSFDFDFQLANKKINSKINNRSQVERGQKGPILKPKKSIFDKFSIKKSPNKKSTNKNSSKATKKKRKSNRLVSLTYKMFNAKKSANSKKSNTLSTNSLFSSNQNDNEINKKNFETFDLSNENDEANQLHSMCSYDMMTERIDFNERKERDRILNIHDSNGWYEANMINLYLRRLVINYNNNNKLIDNQRRAFLFHPRLFYYPQQQLIHIKLENIKSHNLLLFPFNTSENTTGIHWCLGLISISKKSIIILDSRLDATIKSRKNYKDYYDKFFRRLFVAAIIYLKLKGQKVNLEKWKYYLVKDAPQQDPKDGHSCGPFVCYYSCLATTLDETKQFGHDFKAEIRACLTFDNLKETSLFNKKECNAVVDKELIKYVKEKSFLNLPNKSLTHITLEDLFNLLSNKILL